MIEVPPEIRSAICRVRASGGNATGYVVAPRLVVTTARAVAGAASIEITVGGHTWSAKVLKDDAKIDIALLELDTTDETPIGVEPLPLEELDKKVEFLGYGLGDAGFSVHSFRGLVLDPLASDETGQTLLKLFCERTAEEEDFTPRPGSPLIVDGAVIGHWSRPLGDDGVERYGVGFATPVSALRKLGISPRGKKLVVNPLSSAERSIEDLPKGHYHVFISYRSSDRPIAAEVAELLEGAGLRVFLDQKELNPGDALATNLEKALTQSRAAVVLVSRGWLESAWCQKEANVLKQRSVEDAGFKLVPLRLDDSTLPAFLSDLLWLDFRQEKNLGTEVNRLIDALVAADGSKPKVMSSVDRAQSRILDAFRAELKAANDRKHLLRIVADWESYGSPNRTVPIQVAERLVGLNRYEEALAVLKRAGRGLRAEQLRALASDKTGETDEAIVILERLYQEGHRDPETLGILAGIYRRSWKTGKNPAHLERAHSLYREGWETTGDTYNGINTAHLLLIAGKRDEAQKVARQVLGELEKMQEARFDHWQLATVGEAHLINQDLESAKKWYGKAVAKEPALIQDIAVMRNQAIKNLDALGQPVTALDAVLFIPPVMAFTGHMEDAKDRRRKRFPPDKVRDVRRAIEKRLEKIGQTYAFCSAARGSDLIFLEQLLQHGGRAKVVLPFCVEDYKRISVGGQWDEKFDELMNNPRVELAAPKERAPDKLEDQQAAFARTNRQIYGEASKFAKGLDQEPRMLAVWDKKKGDGPGGTADAVEFWKNEDNEVDVIDIRDPLGKGMVLDPRRIAMVAAAVLTLLAALTAVAWRTDMIVPAQQARGVAAISSEVQQSVGFDVNDSAGLFVGIREFDDFPLVPYAVDDAVDLAHLFALELRLIKPENVVLALSGEPQKWSSKKRLARLIAGGAKTPAPDFTEMLKQVRRVPASAGAKGILVLAFATHGFARDGNHYLVMKDSDSGDIVSSGIPVSRLLEEASLAKGHRAALFLDACQERLVRRGVTEALKSTKELYDALGQASGVAVLAGTQLGGYSYDDDEAMNGVFTEAVIEGLGGAAKPLRGAAKAGAAFITIRLLSDYVHERVKKWIEVNRPQDVDVSKGIERRILGDAADLPLAVAK